MAVGAVTSRNAMTFPEISAVYGLAPEQSRVKPSFQIAPEAGSVPVRCPLHVDGTVVLDFGRLLAGRVFIEADGSFDYIYATDPEQLQDILETPPERRLRAGPHETYACASPFGRFEGSAQGSPRPLADEMSVLRLLRIETSAPVTLYACWLDFGAPHMPLAGRFTCSDEELNRIWHMGVYTTLLCTQSNRDALVPVPAPGNGYVIWDGVRRDREVWAGDLRPASLIWLSAYDDPEPVANSLYMFWQARHVGCDQTGMIPGSGSSHQTFYEWHFWYFVNAWEYFEWTGDRHFLKVLNSSPGMEFSLDWVRRSINGDGIMEATNSWMYTMRIDGETAALAIVQVAGLEAMARLFDAAGQCGHAKEALALAQRTREIIPRKFYDEQAGAMRLFAKNDPRPARYPLDANAWAVLYGIGDEDVRTRCLGFLGSPAITAAAGRRCLCPPFGDGDGDWHHFPETCWVHNETVWPYVNSYAAWAYFDAGQPDSAFDVLRAFHRPLMAKGHCTVWEAIMHDGGHTATAHFNLMSLCHAWGGTGAYLLQREVLGIRPGAPGFAKVDLCPQLGSLEFAEGAVPTPHGVIEAELESTSNGLQGKVRLPRGVNANGLAQGIEVLQ